MTLTGNSIRTEHDCAVCTWTRLRVMNGLVVDKYISQQIKKKGHVMVGWKNSWSTCTLGHPAKKRFK